MTNGSTKEKRDVITSKADVVPTLCADGLTSVSPAEALSRTTNADIVISAKPFLNYDVLAEGLLSHYDKNFVSRILDFAKNGTPIGYEGPRLIRDCKKWPSVHTFSNEIQQSIATDVKIGRKFGPFSCPPFANFVASPMGAFRKRSGKVRVIHDLSWPPSRSINDHISPEEYSVKYITLDYIVRRVKLYGRHSLLSKLDISDAFKHILVTPKDWELLGTVFEHTINGERVKQYYIDVVLPFGLRSSPKLFTEFADALQYIMRTRGAVECHHYMDDYITMGPGRSSQCQSNLNIMIQACHDVGFAINPQKLIYPTTVLEFLGFVIDTDLLEIRISQERLSDIYADLCNWECRKKCTKRELLSLIGKLMFISKVVRSGRTFVRRLIELSKRAKYLHHRIKLNSSAQQDIRWWLAYLPTWNGISAFMDDDWTSSVDLQMFTDASDLALAGYFNGEWFIVPLDAEQKSRSINWRELYAIVVAVATWGSKLTSKQLLIHCDNMAVCHILKSGTSKNIQIMTLVRLLFYYCAQYNCVCSAEYISTHDNTLADSLSRLQLSKFRTLAPGANTTMTVPYPVYDILSNSLIV